MRIALVALFTVLAIIEVLALAPAATGALFVLRLATAALCVMAAVGLAATAP